MMSSSNEIVQPMIAKSFPSASSGSLLCDPSQKGLLTVCLQAQKYFFSALVAVQAKGLKDVP